MHLSPDVIALNRFGLGPRGDERFPADPKAWLHEQLDRFEVRPAAFTTLAPAAGMASRYVRQRRDGPDGDAAKRMAMRQAARREARDLYRDSVSARVESALRTPAPFVERLVHFWSNHFAVSTQKPLVTAFAGEFEAAAIRPHVLGRFADMLKAVERHPAMLIYLDQVNSVGPGSRFAGRAQVRNPNRKRGLNENLAREILELHTLGARGGYSQADVRELARAMTGWTVGGAGPGAFGDVGAFLFRPQLHEPGTRVLMGKRYPADGVAQASAMLDDLAASPATARHIATKLARHFVADDPPAGLVERLAASFMRSNGDLPTLYRTLINSPEAWSPTPLKFKTPWEWAVSALRGAGWTSPGTVQMARLLTQLGQPVWRPGSPAGYDDIAASWAAPDALMRRVEFAQLVASRSDSAADPRALAERLFPGSLSPATRDAIARAESPATGLALLLVSPEFQRR